MYFQKKFKKDVIESFVDSYVGGETPIPCIQCNQTVKFRDLYSYAQELRADALVTGHYVSRFQKNGKDRWLKDVKIINWTKFNIVKLIK